jgi:cell wall assembly regulator SMI1
MSNSKGTALHAVVRQRWSIVTGEDEMVRKEAERLTAEAAREAGDRHPDNSAAADAWMDLLRREGTYFGTVGQSNSSASRLQNTAPSWPASAATPGMKLRLLPLTP